MLRGKRKRHHLIDSDSCFKPLVMYDNIKNSVYLLYLGNKLLYIGKSRSLPKRILKHRQTKYFDKIRVLKFNNVSDMHIIEVYLINKLNPLDNRDSIGAEMTTTINIDYKPNGLLVIENNKHMYRIFN